VYEELESFGRIEELNVCANLGDHMIGNVYVKYEEEEMAEKVTLTPHAATERCGNNSKGLRDFT